jgi:nucleosome assembly protein 1-like 1
LGSESSSLFRPVSSRCWLQTREMLEDRFYRGYQTANSINLCHKTSETNLCSTMAFQGDSRPSANPNSGGNNVAPHPEYDDGIEPEVTAPEQPIAALLGGVSLADDDDDDDDDVVAIDDEDDEDGEMEFDNDEDPMSVLPQYVVKRVNKLQDLHMQKEKILEEYLKDRAALELKYQALCRPLYVKRSEIISGTMDETITAEITESDDMTDAKPSEGADVAVGIPQFWVCAMGHMEDIAESISEDDVDCLEHLTDIKCLDDADGNGFTLEFHFGPNEYFQNSILTKRYEVPNLLLGDEPILKNVEGSKIQWFPKKCLTHREVVKKQRGKGKHAGQIRNIKKQERRESFFHFFEPPKMPPMDSMDEDEAERLEELFDADYDVAQAFRSQLIPNAVLWFTGQAMEDEMREMVAMADLTNEGGTASSSPFPAAQAGDGDNPECKQN